MLLISCLVGILFGKISRLRTDLNVQSQNVDPIKDQVTKLKAEMEDVIQMQKLTEENLVELFKKQNETMVLKKYLKKLIADLNHTQELTLKKS